jgi:hypothetical protein
MHASPHAHRPKKFKSATDYKKTHGYSSQAPLFTDVEGNKRWVARLRQTINQSYHRTTSTSSSFN